MILIYRILINLFFPLIIFIIFFRTILKKEDKSRYKEKLFSSFFDVKRDNKKKLIWFHAASIGELKSIVPIIEKINKKLTNEKFIQRAPEKVILENRKRLLNAEDKKSKLEMAMSRLNTIDS